jgi:hypothetical protein
MIVERQPMRSPPALNRYNDSGTTRTALGLPLLTAVDD